MFRFKFVTVVLASSLCFSGSLMAQEYSENRGTLPEYRTKSAEGVRISLVSPFLRVKAKISGAGESASSSNDIDRTLGLSVGYVSLPIQQLGFTTALSYLSLKNDDSESVPLWRASGNLAYTANQSLSIFGGLNLSNIRPDQKDSDFKVDFRPGIGGQLGATFQINKNIGIDLAVVSMRQTAEVYGVDLEIIESGPELTLHGTF